MLKRLHLRNFTVFADAEFEFGPGLNVLVGTNGTGKTHVLKAGYSMQFNLLYRLKIKTGEYQDLKRDSNNQDLWFLEDKIKSIFQPNPFKINELARRGSGMSETVMEIELYYTTWQAKSAIDFTITRPSDPYIFPLPIIADSSNILSSPVFIPAKETLTSGWLLSLYDRREIPIDETYPDLLRLLSGPPLRQPEPAHIIEKLAQLIGGKVEEEGGHFYLTAPDQPRLEMNLVAEGMRKFATLYKLLANGTLTPETTLFWDEPEANLNPALLKEMAVVLTDLAQAGFQIILATHSLFLMKELHILSRQRKQPVRYFGLYAGEKGDVQVEQQNDFMQLQHIAALDAELAQTFDFDEALEQDYAGDS